MRVAKTQKPQKATSMKHMAMLIEIMSKGSSMLPCNARDAHQGLSRVQVWVTTRLILDITGKNYTERVNFDPFITEWYHLLVITVHTVHHGSNLGPGYQV